MKNPLFFAAALFALSFTAPATAGAGNFDSVIREFWTAVDMGNFDKAVTYLSADIQVYLPLSPEPLGREAYRQLGEGFRKGFPDINHKVLEVTEGKMNAAVRGMFSGTNTGSLMGNPPTGNRVETPFLQFWTFDAAGKAVRIEIAFDLASFNGQLMKGIDPNAKTEAAKKSVMAAYGAFGKGDIPGVLALCTDDATWDVSDNPVPGLAKKIHMGKNEISRFFMDLGGKAQFSRFEPWRFLADGDDVIALVRATFKSLEDGKTYSVDAVHHLTMKDGKIASFREVATPGRGM